jgi:hypothetical protein
MNKINEKLLILLFSLFVMLNLSSCLNPLSGNLGICETIEDAKRRGVFVKPYQVPENPYIINDSIVLNVNEAWLEKQWRYGKKVKDASPINGFQMVVTVKGNGFEEYATEWYIGVDHSLNFYPGLRKSIICEFNELPNDTIVVPVQRGRLLAEHIEKDIFAEFKLIFLE